MTHLRSIVLCLVVLGVALPALAQDTPKAELSGGYQLVNYSASGELASLTFSRGWYLDVGGTVNRIVSIVGEVGGAYKSESQTMFGVTANANLQSHQFMGGLRLNCQAAPLRGVRPRARRRHARRVDGERQRPGLQRRQ